jgi:hypothetical protein
MSAIPFITYDPASNQYELHDAARQCLESMDAPLAVVVICGVYRSGKSLLLNKCIVNKPVFGVGNTISACTKGIWMYTEPILTDDGKRVIVLDAEGAFSLSANRTHDTRIFVLALLLSSYFIYNSIKSIDSSALQNLSLVTHLSKYVLTRTGDQGLARAMPSLLWVIRDFSLQLVDTEGRTVTPNQYLEYALSSGSGTDPETTKIQQVLRETFSSKDCRTLVQPCSSEEDLQNLDQVPDSALRPEFLKQIRDLRKHILDKVPIKKIYPDGKVCSVNGASLVLLAVQYLKTINDGSTPVIEDSWQLVSDKQTRQLMDKLERQFRLAVETANPDKLEDLQLAADSLLQSALAEFRLNALCAAMEAELKRLLGDLVTEAVTKHRRRTTAYIQDFLSRFEVTLGQSLTLTEVQVVLEETQASILKTYGVDGQEQFASWWWGSQWRTWARVIENINTELRLDCDRAVATLREELETTNRAQVVHIQDLQTRLSLYHEESARGLEQLKQLHQEEILELKESHTETVRRSDTILSGLRKSQISHNEIQEQRLLELEELQQTNRTLARELQVCQDTLQQEGEERSAFQQVQLESARVLSMYDAQKAEYANYKLECCQHIELLTRDLTDWRSQTECTIDQLKTRHSLESDNMRKKQAQDQLAIAELTANAQKSLHEQEQKYSLMQNQWNDCKKASVEYNAKQLAALQQAESLYEQMTVVNNQERSGHTQALRKQDVDHRTEVRKIQLEASTIRDRLVEELHVMQGEVHELQTKAACNEIHLSTNKRKLQDFEQDGFTAKKTKDLNDQLLTKVGSLQSKCEWLESFYKQGQSELSQATATISKHESTIQNLQRQHETEMLRLTLKYEGVIITMK